VTQPKPRQTQDFFNGICAIRPDSVAGPRSRWFSGLTRSATPPAALPRAGRRIGAAAYDAKAKEMFDLGRQDGSGDERLRSEVTEFTEF
jgi:hypothetical protein